MATGQEQLTRLEYQQKLEAVSDNRQLLIMLGMEIYDVKVNCARACAGGGGTGGQKVANATGITGFVGMIYLLVIELMRMRGGG